MKFKTLKLIPLTLLLFVASIAMSQEHKIEVEDAELSEGIRVQKCAEGGKNIGFINNGGHILIKKHNFKKGVRKIIARVAAKRDADTTIQVIVGKLDNEPVAELAVSSTGGWQKWTDVKGKLKSKIKKEKDIYLKFIGKGKSLLNVNYIEFK